MTKPHGIVFAAFIVCTTTCFSDKLVHVQSASAVESMRRNNKTEGGDSATAPVFASHGFEVLKIYTVPGETQGSWVSLTVDNRGRLITSDQAGKLYRITVLDEERKLVAPTVEPITVDIGSAQGLCYLHGSLYLVVNNVNDKANSGLYRLSASDRDDNFDTKELLLQIDGMGEHGTHGVIPGPGGKSLYICSGNLSHIPIAKNSRIPQRWQEDNLLPRMWDPSGMFRGILAPGGWVYRFDLESRTKGELIAVGLRNPYDIAFNEDGELFTVDADMEWDIGLPWYRPTRVCHVTSGAEFGWRSGSGKWAPYYPDSLPATVNLGPGSPTGIVFGYGANLPEKFQRALFVCDWSYGRIHAVHLAPSGSSYTGTFETITSATPLPVTDIVVNPLDGAIYFTTGGRQLRSALYRLTYTGDGSPSDKQETRDAGESVKNNESLGSAARAVRHKLEALHKSGAKGAVDVAWPFLSDPDRFIRYAARIAIEHQSPETWQDVCLAERNPIRSIQSIIALARCGDKRLQHEALVSLMRIDFDELSKREQLNLLRAYQLLMIRMGKPNEALTSSVVQRLRPYFPATSQSVNIELSRLLVYLEAPNIVERILKHLETAPPQLQIHYLSILRTLHSGWTVDQRRTYLTWFHHLASTRAGVSFQGYLKQIYDDAVKSLSDADKNSLADEINNPPHSYRPQESVSELAKRPFVKDWQMDDLIPLVQSTQSARSFENGRKMFSTALCFNCHRMRGEGETIGPDLTAVGSRFGTLDLLSSIIEPSRVIPDQYLQTVFLVNGKTIVGRIVNMNKGQYTVSTDMLDPAKCAVFDVADIDEQFLSNVSQMPSGLLNTLTEEEILNLVAFLRSGGDPDHPLFKKGIARPQATDHSER